MSRTIEFVVDCGVKEERAGNIIFLEPIGGLSNVACTEVNTGGSGNYSETVLHTEPDDAFADWSAYGGRVQIRRTGSNQVSMSSRVEYSQQYRNFVASMSGSPLAYLQMKDRSGAWIFVKANLQSASISAPGPDGFSTIQITAGLAHDYEGQRSVY
jgi:hypothetical protein